VVGTVVLVGIYLLANVAYLAALGSAAAARSDEVAADAVRTLFGPAAAKALAVPIIISMVGAANGIALTAPRAYYAMARDGVFFRRLGEVHPRFGTPAVAIVTSSAWAMVLAATGTFRQLFTYVVFAGWVFYALGALSVFAFRRKIPEAPRSFRVPGYPWTPLAFVLAAAAIIGNTLFTRPGEALLGVGVVLLGAPVFYAWRRRGSAS
jgi:APA family basic amino acid/polyamine antiporter